MKRGHFGKSPKGKGGNYHNKSRKSGGRGGASPHGSAVQGDTVAPRRNRSRSNGFQEFGNFLWTYDASTNHWVARESDSSPPPSSAAIDIGSGSGSHSKAALRELSEFGREFPAAHKGKKGRGNNGGGGGRKGQHQVYSKSNPQSSMADDDLDDASAADHAFVGFRSSSSPHYKSASPASASGSSFMMRFVKGETMNDEREKHADDDGEAAPPVVAVKIEAMQEVKLEVEVKLEQPPERDVSSHARPVRWQSEPAIPKYTPVVSPSRALGMPSATTPQQAFSGRGRGRGRGRGAAVTNSPTSPADFHWTYTEKTLNADIALEEANAAILGVVIKQEQEEEVVVVEPDNGGMVIAMSTATTATTTAAVPAQGKPGVHQQRNSDKQAKKNNKKNKKWEEKQLRNRTRIGLEPMESDSALFTTRDLVRAKMQTGAYDKAAQRNKSSEDDEENAQADEDFLFGRGGREMRKGAPVKGKMPTKGNKQQKKGKKGFVYDMDDEDSEDDGMVLDEELIRDYMLNTELDDLNLDEDAMEEHLLLHIVSQLNDYHLSDDDDDDDDDDDEDEEEEGDEDDGSEEDSDEEESDEDDSEEDIYDEYGDDEKEEEKELAKKLKEKAAAKAKKTKKTPLGLAAWDDAETAVVDAAADDETFDAVLNADFTLLRSDRPPSFNQRLQKAGGGKWASRDEQRGSPYQRGNKSNSKKWKTPEKGGKGRYTKKGKWYDQEFNEETITDEEELPYIDRTPLKGQPRTPNGMVTVHSINESIRNFIANDDKEWLELPPMNKKQRVMVHQLCQLYHLKSKSYGMGRHRFPTLVKTVYSCYPPQAELLEFLNRAAKIKATNGAPAPRKKLSKEENKQLRKLKNMRKRDGGKETFVSTKREMDGKVVGEGAVPLGQETIGARLLLSMGWSGGGLVGTNGEGIAEPLMAIVKNNRKGLGF